MSLSAQRDRVQRQVEELERSLAVTRDELDLLSSETDDGSESQDEEGQSPADLLAQKQKIQSEIQNLEDMLGPHSESLDVSSEDSSDSSDRTEPDLSPSASSCLQLNLVYQQVVQETLDQLEALLAHNRRQQRELTAQMNGPIRESTREGPASSNQHPAKMFLGSFLKPYFKDRLTGLGPPANQEVKLKAQRMMGCPEDKKLKLKRWESWQKTLLVHSVTRDHLKRLMLPKLSRLDFLTSKFSSAQGADRQQLTEQINDLEKDLQLLRMKREEELTGDRYEEHDWQKISNIDFEGTKDAEDIRLFWQNVLHPSINKTAWSSEEVQRLSAICRRHEDRHWDSIAQELGTGRTAFMCLQMFQRFVSDSLKRSSWTAEEDEQLRELVQKMRIGNFIPYTQISYFMEGRDPTQLVYRWNQVLDPSLKRGSWTKQEDRLLLQAVARHGEKCWWKVRLEVPGRTDGACRDRYLDCLKKNIKKGPFERHEVELLEQLVKKHGVGRWAKIAAEIPHRLDAQCLREWRKLVREPAQDRRKIRKTCKKGGRGRGRGRGAGGFNVSIRRGILKMKEEEEVQVTEDEDEDEDEVVQYMDSDEDCNKKRKRSMEEEEEEEEEYILPPMEEWLPAEVKQSSTSLSFTLVELPSSGEAPDRTAVRSTVLGRPGPSVVIGAPPRELSWEERRSSSAVPMASREALRLHLSALKQKVGSAPQPGRRPRPQAQELRYELQVAVTPWIGNLLIPKSQKRSAADALREAGERSGVSTSSAFTLLLQAMNVDTLGCRQMIEERKSKADLQAPPHARGPKRVSELLANRRSQEEEDQRRVLLQEKRILQAPPIMQAPPILQAPPQHPSSRYPQMFPRSLLVPAASIYFVPSGAPPAPPAPPAPVLPNPEPSCTSSSVVPVGSSLTSSLARGSPAELKDVGGASDGAAGSRSDVGGAKAGVARTGDEGAKNGADLETGPMDSAGSPEPDRTQNSDGPAAVSSSSSPLTSAPPSCPVQTPPTSTDAAVRQSGGRKRGLAEAGGAGPVQEGKRTRRPTLKIQESKELQATKKRSSASSKQKRVGRAQSKESSAMEAPPHSQAPPLSQVTGLHFLPNRSIWVMTPGSVPVAQAPPPALQVGLLPRGPPLISEAPPPLTAGLSSVTPADPRDLQLLPVPTCRFKPLLPAVIQSPDLRPTGWPRPHLLLAYQGAAGRQTVGPTGPPLPTAGLHFDPTLMCLEPPEEVHDWLRGRGGVVVPGARCALPYLPPSVSSLSALSGLLRAKASVTASALQLMADGRRPNDHTYCASGELPGRQEELQAVRQLVAQRFSTNPAHQLLKARFLSLFTLPALLATVQPISRKKPTCPTNQEEEEEEEEEELKQIQERQRRRRRVLTGAAVP
ncbi:snRNA-activating protein complex subunit 4 isoform X2 [Xiphophorus couchianus]|uniref:snRNA-activating protein complex subunit 4 isoform X2 n=1 Tax=Xiphophorus couchianus TaxID=32473 RepID=UPI001016FD4A|nr:snRNA-activating protein complex subunit 4 isoform X2 [Xiphophorus couchianus]